MNEKDPTSCGVSTRRQPASWRTLRLCLAVLILVLVGLSAVRAGATEVLPISLNETVRQSDGIVLGSVRSLTSRWGDASHRFMVTDYTFAVDEVLAGGVVGAAGGTITLTYWGGTIDGETQSISDLRLPAVGEQLVLMLRPGWNGELRFAPVVGLHQGLFSVSAEVTGGPAMVHSHDGRPLVLSAGGQVMLQRDAGVQAVQATGVELSVFKQWLRGNLAGIRAAASELPNPRVEDPRVLTPLVLLPETGSSPGAAALPVAADRAPGMPQASPKIPAEPSAATPRQFPAQSGTGLLQSIAPQYTYDRLAHLPIVVNNFPDSFTPWSPEDEWLMSRWNHYASDVFHVLVTPTGTYGWPNDRFDLDGWPSSDQMLATYGSGWEPLVLGVTYTRSSSGWILEADIALNPAYSWTLDDEWIFNGGTAIGFRQTMIHELGHMFGLAHQFNYLSVMNYPPMVYRHFSSPFMDDAEAIRAMYPSQTVGTSDLGVYLFSSAGYQDWDDVSLPGSVAPGGLLTFSNFHIENVGTETIANPAIEWYLTSARNFNGSYYYLGTGSYPSLARFNYFTPSVMQHSFTVPGNVPAGQYYLAAFIRNDGAVGQGSFPFDNNSSFSRLPITVTAQAPSNDSCGGAIALQAGVPYTMSTGYATDTGDPALSCTSGGKGVWFSFTPAVTGQVTVSTCGSSFDSVLEVFSGSCASHTTLSCNDDGGPACTASVNASLSFSGVAGTTYRIYAGGFGGSSGNLTIQASLVPSGDPDIRIAPTSLAFDQASQAQALSQTIAALSGGTAPAAASGSGSVASAEGAAAVPPEKKLVRQQEIQAGFDKGDKVRVTVNLTLPPSAQEPVDFRSHASAQAFRVKVKGRQDEVLAKLPAQHVKTRHRFENIAAFSAEVTREGLQALLADPRVASVEPVFELQPHLAQGLPLIGGDTYRASYDGSGVAIAICDTGVDYNHPRLGGGGFPNAKVIGGYDFGDLDADPAPGGEAHGTACAGIAAGSLGTSGDYIGGVAPGSKLYALKISSGSSGSASSDAMVAAWDWSVTHRNDDPANPIMVISTSFGGGQYFDSCDAAVPSMTAAANNAVAAGITLFVSSGNDGYCNAVSWPACISSVNAVGAVYDASFGTYTPCVSASSCATKIATTGCTSGYYVADPTSADRVTAYSNTAAILSLLAPGNQASTLDITGSGGYASGDYTSSFGGTSAACPYTAGAAAALQSAAKTLQGAFLSPQQVRSTLNATGNGVTDSKTPITKPRLNLARAIESLGGTGSGQSFRIYNDGGTTLEVQGIAPQSAAPWITVQPSAPFSVAPGGYQDVSVSVDYLQAPAGTSTTRLLVTSNDPDESPYPGGVDIAVTRSVTISTALTVSPSAPDGENGWYRSAPVITLSASEPGTTRYRWGSAPAFSVSSEPHEWVPGGTALGIQGDDTGAWYTLPFSFSFYGTSYSQVYVNSNGLLRFDQADISYSNSGGNLAGRVAIAALWDDLLTYTRAGDDVYVFQPDADSVGFRWQAVTIGGRKDTNFEAILYRDGRIRLNYDAQEGDLSPTVGISRGDGVNLLVAYNNNLPTSNGIASLVYTPAAWYTYSAPFSVYDSSATLSYYSTDTAGGSEPVQSRELKVDRTAPAVSPSPGSGNYSSLNVTLSCSDQGTGGVATSGCAATYYCLGAGCTPSLQYSAPIAIGASTTLNYYARDLAGNQSGTQGVVYNIGTRRLTVNSSAGGYLSASPGVLLYDGAAYPDGTVVTLTATSYGGYTFTGWTGCDSVSGNQCSVTMNADRSVSASFSTVAYQLSVTKQGSGAGSVTPDSGSLTWSGNTGTGNWAASALVTLTATPDAGNQFEGWSGCDSMSENRCSLTMTGARSVSASFAPVIGTAFSILPAAPDGENGWYRSVPTVTLSPSLPGTTYYRWGSAPAYTVSSDSAAWIDGGTPLNIKGDDVGAWYTLPFSFTFYGKSYDRVFVNSNGLLNFEEPDYSFWYREAELTGKVAITPFTSDLSTSGTGQDVYVIQPDADTVVFRWQAVRLGSTDQANFEAVLKRDGGIRFNYGAQDGSIYPTIGISRGDGVNFLVAHDRDLASTSGMDSILYTPAVWYTYSAPFRAYDSNSTLYYYSADAAGHEESPQSQAVKVDRVAPATAAAPETGNYSSPQNVTLTCSDSGTASGFLLGGTLQGSPLVLSGEVTTIAGTAGASGSTDGTGPAARFEGLVGATTDGTNLYLTDYRAHTIRKVVLATGEVTTVAGTAGSSGSSDGTGSAARFSLPIDVTTDGANLYVSDWSNSTIRKIVLATGAVTTLAGSPGAFGSADGVGSAARFGTPWGITTDGTNLYVADYGNHTIRKIDIATGTVTTIAGTPGVSGSADGTGSAARFFEPIGITLDGTNLYVTDSSNTVRKIVLATGAVTTIAGSAGNAGTSDGTGSAARFSRPAGIIADGTSLYLSDSNNYTVRKISLSSGQVTTVAGTAGSSGSADGVGTGARFTYTYGLASDGRNVYVADFNNMTVRKLTGSSTGSASGCAATYYCLGADCTPASLYNGPVPVASSTTLRYYSTDVAGNREGVETQYYNIGTQQLTVTWGGTGWGWVTPDAGTLLGNSAVYPPGSTVNLTANPDGISSFTGWSGCDSVSGNVCTVTMSADRTVTANFARITYPLTVTKSGTGTGTVTPDYGSITWTGNSGTGNYDYYATVTLTAVATSGSVFTGWSGCDSVSGNACTVTMNGARNVTASFTASTKAAYLRAAVDPWGQGSTNAAAMTAVFGAENTGWYTYQMSGGLGPFEPGAGFSFVFLDASYLGGNELTSYLAAYGAQMEQFVAAGGVLFINDAPSDISNLNLGFGGLGLIQNVYSQASAASASHPVIDGPMGTTGTTWSGTAFGHGTVSGSGLTPIIYGQGSTNIILGEKTWGSGLLLVGGMTTTNFHSPQPQAANLRANILKYGATFSAPVSVALGVTKGGTGTGTVVADSGTLSWTDNLGTANYTLGTSVTLTATPAAGSTLGAWGGCDSSAGNQCTVALNAARNVTVTFNSTSVGVSATGSLATGRRSHTSTLLPNGRILVTGGYAAGDVPTASAEIWDPATGTWSSAPAMGSPRVHHTATVLPTGKVLVAGGSASPKTSEGGITLSSAEIYDPATNSWSPTGALASGRLFHSATLLKDGRLLVAGGTGAGLLSSSEIYDPASGSWSATGSLATARRNHVAALLASGKVLVAGGRDGATTRYSSAELYDPATGSWSPAGSMSVTRSDPSATVLTGGKVLVAGGSGAGGVMNASAELYDPSGNSWSPTGALGTARQHHSATLLPNGMLLVAGGWNSSDGVLSSTELYDPATGAWSPSATLSRPYEWHTATLLTSGKVLLAAGTGSYQTGAELYSYASGTFTASSPMNEQRAAFTATMMPGGKVLIVGGWNATGYVSTAQLYDRSSGTMTATGSLPAPRGNHTATLLPNGKVLIAGGWNDTTSFQACAQLYDPAAGSFAATGCLNTPRAAASATLLANGKVLVAGGISASGYTASAEVYDPATGTFSVTASLSSPRNSHSATLLPNGKVLIAGGWNSAGALNGAELYDPANGSISTIGAMNARRSGHTASLLASGKVLIAGGSDGNGDLASAEVYDMASGSFTAIADLARARSGARATTLRSGEVLISGGPTETVELFDPAAMTFRIAGSFLEQRRGHTATLLPDGRVFFAGGIDLVGRFLDTTEVYDPGFNAADSRRPNVSPSSGTGKVVLTGSRLRGDSEGSSGAPDNNSATNYPVVMLQRVDDGRRIFMPSDPGTSWTDTSFTMHNSALAQLPVGAYHVNVYVSGVPSIGKILQVAPVATFTPSPLDFGNVAVGSSSAAQTLTVTNTGTTPLVIQATYLDGPNRNEFSGGTLDCGASLAPGASCQYSYVFQPTAAGARSARMSVSAALYDDPAQSVLFTGTGVGASDYPLTVTVSGTGSGSVVPDSGSLVWSGHSGTGTYPSNATVTLTATPSAGSQIGAWGGCNSITAANQCTVTMGAARNVTVSFISLNSLATSLTGPLAQGRRSHTGTPLPNGKILVTGGYVTGDLPTATAEIYDPATGTWSGAGSMASARVLHTATVLPSGRVLVVGGSNLPRASEGSAWLATAELYDPATNSWGPAASLATGRLNHSATLLPNGKLLVAGGGGASGALASAELYDPSTDSWSAAGSLATGRRYHLAALLPGGKVLVAGGRDSGTARLASAELYDPSANSWSPAGAMAYARSEATATVLAGGKVLVAGGGGVGGAQLANSEIYDPASNSWGSAAPLAVARHNHTATLLPNGMVLVTGGWNSADGPLASCELYDPASGVWSLGASLTTTREWHTAVPLPGGKVVLAGGRTSYLASAEVYDYAAGTFGTTGSMAVGRDAQAASILPGGKVLVAGGWGPAGTLNTAELYDPATGLFTPTGTMNAYRGEASATLLNNGKVLLAGGWNQRSFELYDQAAGTFTLAGYLSVDRSLHTATLLPDGRVLIAGGGNQFTSSYATAEIYDPTAGSLTAAGSMTTARTWHSATLLSDGRVLLAGGWSNSTQLASAELYDPGTGTFTQVGNMAVARSGHKSVLLPDGKVLIVGGGTLAAEIFDPVTGSFSSAGNLVNWGDSQYPSATLLANGKVLISGGTLTAELYDPATGQFAATGNMALYHGRHTATPLPGGKVLLIGSSSEPACELFDPGLGLDDGDRPVVSGISGLTGKLVVSGSGFRGNQRGNGGSVNNNSATDYPVVQFRRIDNGQQSFVLSDPSTPWSDTGFTLSNAALGGLTSGSYLVTVFASGVPSASQVVAIAPVATFSPSDVDFGSVAVGSTSASRAVSLTNSGTSTLAIGATYLGGPDTGMFGGTTTCGASLAPGASCQYDFTFHPTAAGARSATVSISARLLSDPAQSVHLTGTGVNGGAPTISGNPPATVASDAFYDFTPGSSNAASFTVTNKPGWAGFDTATGRLSGTPGAAAIGIYSDIRITAVNGGLSATLGPFAIAVTPAANLTVMLPGGSPEYFASITDAYAIAWTGSAVKPQAITYTENLLFNRPVSFKLDGGMFDGSGGFTNVRGTLDIRQGTVDLSKINFIQ